MQKESRVRKCKSISKTVLGAIWYRLRYFIKDDLTYLKGLWRIRMDYPLNLNHPRTFSEKIQWLKLYDRKPAYSMMVDKIEAKKYVSSIIGAQYVIPTIGVWDDPKDIDFNKLPDRFVIKCNHNSGLGMYICKDKSSLNISKVCKGLAKGLRENYYIKNREWPYKNVRPRIIAERYLDSGDDDLKDYKFFCFGGSPMYCQVIGGRNKITSSDFFNMDWEHQIFHEPHNYPFSKDVLKCPSTFSEMRDIARTLSKGLPFLRVDLYEVKGRVYFGEMTFSPTTGMGGFDPVEWDYEFGSLLHLPTHAIIS